MSKNYSNQLNLMLKVAIENHKKGFVKEAKYSYEKILKINARQVDALHFLGLIKRNEGDLKGALDLLGRAADIDSKNVTIQASLGNVLLELHCYEEALICYDKFLVKIADFPEVIGNKANALSALGRESEAMDLYNRALRLDPNFKEAYFNRGNLYMDLKNPSKALEDYDCVILMDDRNIQAFNNRGNALSKLERWDDAVNSYELGLRIDPESPELIAGLANAYKTCGNIARSVDFYNMVLSKNSVGFTRQNAALQLAILHYFYGDSGRVDILLDVAKEMCISPHGKDKGSLIYCLFLMKIRLWWKNFGVQNLIFNRDNIIYAVGESHIMSIHNMIVPYLGSNFQCKGLWIEGCTQWKIGRVGENTKKKLLSSYLSSLPNTSVAFLSVGEIDCRIDGKLFAMCKKNTDNDCLLNIEELIFAYLNEILNITKNKHLSLIVCGVPAQNLNINSYIQSDLNSFGKFLASFNAILKRKALEVGMAFLDVFGLTNDGSGRAIDGWHIDEHHLRPDAMVFAFQRHLTIAKESC